MRTGIELLAEATLVLESACGCGRPRCRMCALRDEVEAYLAIAVGKAANRNAVAQDPA